MTQPTAASGTARHDSAWAVFLVFLRLGLTSFGGPVAHLGYFRAELVERRKWLDEAAYVDIVALRNAIGVRVKFRPIRRLR